MESGFQNFVERVIFKIATSTIMLKMIIVKIPTDLSIFYYLSLKLSKSI